jgi:hypothetical protein
MDDSRKSHLLAVIGLLILAAGVLVLLYGRTASLRKAALEGHAVVSESADAFLAVGSVSSPAEQVSLDAAEKRLATLGDAVLYVWATDGLPIGPRAGIKDVPESTLKALANFELEHRKSVAQKREADAERNERRAIEASRRWDIGLAAIAGFITKLVGDLLFDALKRWRRRSRARALRVSG